MGEINHCRQTEQMVPRPQIQRPFAESRVQDRRQRYPRGRHCSPSAQTSLAAMLPQTLATTSALRPSQPLPATTQNLDAGAKRRQRSLLQQRIYHQRRNGHRPSLTISVTDQRVNASVTCNPPLLPAPARLWRQWRGYYWQPSAPVCRRCAMRIRPGSQRQHRN